MQIISGKAFSTLNTVHTLPANASLVALNPNLPNSGKNLLISVSGLSQALAAYTAQVFYGSGAPTGNPASLYSAAIYYDKNTYQVYFWNPDTQSW